MGQDCGEACGLQLQQEEDQKQNKQNIGTRCAQSEHEVQQHTTVAAVQPPADTRAPDASKKVTGNGLVCKSSFSCIVKLPSAMARKLLGQTAIRIRTRV